jgi:hypothetical protein
MGWLIIMLSALALAAVVVWVGVRAINDGGPGPGDGGDGGALPGLRPRVRGRSAVPLAVGLPALVGGPGIHCLGCVHRVPGKDLPEGPVSRRHYSALTSYDKWLWTALVLSVTAVIISVTAIILAIC